MFLSLNTSGAGLGVWFVNSWRLFYGFGDHKIMCVCAFWEFLISPAFRGPWLGFYAVDLSPDLLILLQLFSVRLYNSLLDFFRTWVPFLFPWKVSSLNLQYWVANQIIFVSIAPDRLSLILLLPERPGWSICQFNYPFCPLLFIFFLFFFLNIVFSSRNPQLSKLILCQASKKFHLFRSPHKFPPSIDWFQRAQFKS